MSILGITRNVFEKQPDSWLSPEDVAVKVHTKLPQLTLRQVRTAIWNLEKKGSVVRHPQEIRYKLRNENIRIPEVTRFVPTGKYLGEGLTPPPGVSEARLAVNKIPSKIFGKEVIPTKSVKGEMK